MIGANLDEHGLVIELKETPANNEKQIMPASTFTPPGTQICHHAYGKALAVLPKDMIEKAERETDDENLSAPHTHAKASPTTTSAHHARTKTSPA